MLSNLCVSFRYQFRFADSVDILLMLVGTIMAMGNGAILPAMVIVFGDMTNSFVADSTAGSLPPNMSLGGESKKTFYMTMSIYFDI